MDSVIEYACKVPAGYESNITGLERKAPPEPLLPNLGYANVMAYEVDMLVSDPCNLYTTRKLTGVCEDDEQPQLVRANYR